MPQEVNWFTKYISVFYYRTWTEFVMAIRSECSFPIDSFVSVCLSVRICHNATGRYMYEFITKTNQLEPTTNFIFNIENGKKSLSKWEDLNVNSNVAWTSYCRRILTPIFWWCWFYIELHCLTLMNSTTVFPNKKMHWITKCQMLLWSIVQIYMELYSTLTQ